MCHFSFSHYLQRTSKVWRIMCDCLMRFFGRLFFFTAPHRYVTDYCSIGIYQGALSVCNWIVPLCQVQYNKWPPICTPRGGRCLIRWTTKVFEAAMSLFATECSLYAWVLLSSSLSGFHDARFLWQVYEWETGVSDRLLLCGCFVPCRLPTPFLNFPNFFKYFLR